MPAPDDLALLIAAAEAAGEIARRYWKRDPRSWDKPEGGGPVTEADLEIDLMLRAQLGAARPDYGWLSEESADAPERLGAERVFIVDPIDGTRAFIEGSPSWSHSLAVAEAGRITAAVVFLPIPALMYAARLGAGARLGGEPITVSAQGALTDASVLASRSAFEPWHWREARVPQVNRQMRASLAWRLSLVAEGRFDAMLSLRPTWEWDVAAGSLIVAEAGGRVTDRHGGPLVFNRPTPQLDGIVAAAPLLHQAIADRLFV